MKPTIHILCSADDKFVPYCGVMLTSLLQNINRPYKINRKADVPNVVIHLISEGLSPSSKTSLLRMEAKYRCVFDFMTLTESQKSALPESINGWPPASYLRLIAMELLPRTLSRIIYLDCDVAVDVSILPLWEMDLKGCACAAVADSPHSVKYKQRAKAMGLKGFYFNSGVMVMDLDVLRSLDFSTKCNQLLAQDCSRFNFPDQDILNVLLDGHVYELPLRWNVQTAHLQRIDGCALTKDELAEIGQVLRQKGCGIIHYSGTFKPWKNGLNSFTPLEHIWRKYLKISLWDKNLLIPVNLHWKERIIKWRHAVAYRHGYSSAYDHLWRSGK